MSYSLFDIVALKVDLPEQGLRSGAIGAVVDVYTKPSVAYEVEFCDSRGRTVAMLALAPEQIRPA
jgi:Domain of unknown function (DUF4926)